MAKERLDKLLASQGMGSGKEVAHLIRTGQVIVDGNLEKHPESKWDPETASIVINGRSLLFQRFCYPQAFIHAVHTLTQHGKACGQIAGMLCHAALLLFSLLFQAFFGDRKSVV